MLELSPKNWECSEPGAGSSLVRGAPADTGKTGKAAKCYMSPQTLIYKLVLNLCCTADSSYESTQMYS